MQITISALLEGVRDGELALPEFQRDYRWPANNIEELLRSVARGWPIGTFLFLDQSSNPKGLRLKPRKLDEAPPCKSRPRHLILDGQQRITALFQAMNGLGASVFYIDLGLLLEAEEFVDECLDSVRRKQVESKLGNSDRRRKEKIILLEELYSTEQFLNWLSYLTKSDKKKFAPLRDDHLASFREHTVTVENLSNDLPVEAIAKIFERTNRGFLKLDAFDLMVAIMYPHQFKLRDKWESAKSKHSVLRQFAVEPIEILRLIALREHLRQKKARLSPQTVKGVRQSDVLQLKPAVVKKEWNGAVEAYARALTLAETSWGVAKPRIVPAETQLLPLADVLSKGGVRIGSARHKKLARWFWASIFSRRYAQAANTRAVSDTEDLRDWVLGRGGEPSVVKNFKITTDDFALVEEGNEIFVRGLCCLLNSLGARGWAKSGSGDLPPLVQDLDAELAIHHVFPRKFMTRKGKDALRKLPDVNVPANQVVITASLNSALLNEAPEHAVKNPDVDIRGLETHYVDPERMYGRKFKQFVDARSAALVPIVDRAVKGY